MHMLMKKDNYTSQAVSQDEGSFQKTISFLIIFVLKSYFVHIHQKVLIEAISTSSLKICFYAKITNIMPNYHFIRSPA